MAIYTLMNDIFQAFQMEVLMEKGAGEGILLDSWLTYGCEGLSLSQDFAGCGYF